MLSFDWDRVKNAKLTYFLLSSTKEYIITQEAQHVFMCNIDTSSLRHLVEEP